MSSSEWLENYKTDTPPKIGLDSEKLYGNGEWRSILYSSVLRDNEWKFFGMPPVLYAYIFSGAVGYGKHTLENAYASTVCTSGKYRLFEIPEYDLLGADSKETCRNISAVFKELAGYTSILDDAVTVDEETGKKSINYFCFLKFGSLDTILSKKKTAVCFADCLKRLRQVKGKGYFIVTACCDDESSIVPYVRSGAEIISLSLPTEQDRLSMFSDFFQNNKYIVTEKNADVIKLSDMTDGMSFGELASTLNMMKMLYKGKYLNQHEIEDFKGIKTLDPELMLYKSELEIIINSVRHKVSQPNIGIPMQAVPLAQQDNIYSTLMQYRPVPEAMMGQIPVTSDIASEKEESKQTTSTGKEIVTSSELDMDDLPLDF